MKFRKLELVKRLKSQKLTIKGGKLTYQWVLMIFEIKFQNILTGITTK